MGKLINTQKLHNTLLNNQGIKEETKVKFKSFLGQMKVKTKHISTYGMQQKQWYEGNS